MVEDGEELTFTFTTGNSLDADNSDLTAVASILDDDGET